VSKKLMTLPELADYLGLDAARVIALVDKGVIPAYKIAGELLRFQKDQIDAIRSEIDVRMKGKSVLPEKERTVPIVKRATLKPKRLVGQVENNTFVDAVADFFYFNDFYIFSAIFVVLLLVVIFRG